MTLLNFHTTVTGTTAVIALTGELDVSGAGLLEQELERVTTDFAVTELVLDLRGLRFMDSSGLRLIVLADARFEAAGRNLVLVRGQADVQRVFEMTRMEERLTFVDDVPEVS